MRYVLIGMGALVAAMAATVEPSFAEPRPWCLQGGGGLTKGDFDDCTYHTLAQCKAAGGNGAAACFPNKALQWRALEESRKHPAAQRPLERRN
jgi:hypothetical protein